MPQLYPASPTFAASTSISTSGGARARHRVQSHGIVYDPNDPVAKRFFTMLAAGPEAEGGWISIRTRAAMARA